MHGFTCARKMKSQTENIMKQFNLDEYLKNPLKKVVMRDGRNVRIICTDFDNPNFPVIGEVKGSKWPCSFTKEGMHNRNEESDADLFFAPEKYEGWLNVYRHIDTGEVTFGAILHTSREKAEKMGRADGYYAATAKIEWEE